MKHESKEERFKRVAEKRVQNAIKSLRSVSQLANSKVYKWNDQQLQKIWKVLDKELEDCKKSFNEPDADLFRL